MRKKQIIEKDGVKYEVVKILEGKQTKKIIVNNWDLSEYEKWYDEKYCIEAVKQNGDSLQYVKDQTEAICIEAVKQNGYSLRYVDKRVFKDNISIKKDGGMDGETNTSR